MMSLRASLLAATVLAAAPVLAADLPARKAPTFAAPESFSHWQMRVRALAVLPQEELKFDQNAAYGGYIRIPMSPNSMSPITSPRTSRLS